MMTHKQILVDDVEEILATHRAVNLCCSASNLLTSLVQHARETHKEITENDGKNEDDTGSVMVTTCMCCQHWVSRRMTLKIVPLPMQVLRWFVVCLKSYEQKRCDVRVLMRMARTVTNSQDNVYRSLFLPVELRFLATLVHSYKVSPQKPIEDVKKHIARFWHAQNGHTLLLPSPAVAELLRAPVAGTHTAGHI